MRRCLVGELVARPLPELLHAQHALGVVLLAPLLAHALGELLAAAALRELPQDEREALGEVGRLHTLELLGRGEAELHKVVGHRPVVFGLGAERGHAR